MAAKHIMWFDGSTWCIANYLCDYQVQVAASAYLYKNTGDGESSTDSEKNLCHSRSKNCYYFSNI